MRRLASLSVLLAASQALRAEEAETPFLVYREADPATAKRIERDLVTGKQLGGMDPAARRQTREDLARIGPWAVPFLSTALRKESSARIRLNAVIALVLIRDPRGLPALRAAAKEDGDISVRRAATLAIGTFECPRDFDTLKGLLGAPRGEWRSAAPALARRRSAANPRRNDGEGARDLRTAHQAASAPLLVIHLNRCHPERSEGSSPGGLRFLASLGMTLAE